MTTEAIDALFGNFRPGRFTDPEQLIQEKLTGYDNIQPQSFIGEGAVEDVSFTSGIMPVLVVGALPSAASYPDRVAFLTTDQKLYRSDGVSWTAEVPASDVTGLVTGAIEVLGALPTLPDAAYGEGVIVFLTTDDKLYRSTGTTWTAAVPTTDLSGTIVAGQIATNAVTADKILAGAVTAGKIAADAVTATELAANAVTADKILAGSITAGKLESELVLASSIKTATSGARVELDTNGFRSYDSSSGLTVNIPSDGVSPVTISAEVQASSLVVGPGDAVFQGDNNELGSGSELTLASALSNPSQAPALAASWPSLPSMVAPSIASYKIAGGYFDTSGGGGTDDCFVALVGDITNSLVKVYEWKMSDGTVARTTTLSGTSNGFVAPTSLGAGKAYITRMGTRWYVSTDANNDGTYDKFTFSRTTGVNDSVAAIGTTTRGALTQDGTNVYAYLDNSSIGQYDSDFVFLGSGALSGMPGAGGQNAIVWDSSTSAFWVGSSLDGNIYKATASGPNWAVVANTAFPSAVSLATNLGFCWDGTNFFSVQVPSVGIDAVAFQHTTWDWTTASSKYWVAYSWYDSVGTTHESQAGPRGNITMGRRQQLTVTAAAIPGAGGADEPTNVRVYMLPNATDPGLTALKLQSTIAGASSVVLSTYASGGAADPGANGFAALGTPALLQSAGTGFILKGSGFINRLGTSFPGSPATGDQYWRSDLGLDFFYDGTRWLSTTLFNSGDLPALAFSIAATTTPHTRAGVPPLSGGSDLFIVDHHVQFLVSGGTALGASHKWVGTFNKSVTGNTQTLVNTVNIASGSSDVFRTTTTAIDALLNGGTLHFELRTTWTKTGTPGSLFVMEQYTYRIVAT